MHVSPLRVPKPNMTSKNPLPYQYANVNWSSCHRRWICILQHIMVICMTSHIVHWHPTLGIAFEFRSISRRSQTFAHTDTHTPSSGRSVTNFGRIHSSNNPRSRSLRLDLVLRGGGLNDGDDDINIDVAENSTPCPEPCCEMPPPSEEEAFFGEDLGSSLSAPPPKHAILFMDRFCHYHGGYLASQARNIYGVATIDVLSTYVAGYLLRGDGDDNDDRDKTLLKMKLPSPTELESWREKLPPGMEIVAVICESDSGLGEAELLSDALSVQKRNGFNEARRDKFLMNECVSKYGLRTVRQKMCSSLEEAIDFAEELGVAQASAAPVSALDVEVGAIASTDTIKSTRTLGDNVKSQSSVQQQKQHSRPRAQAEEGLNTGRLGRASNVPNGNVDDNGNGTFCVIKPTRGVASDDVQFCSNLDEVKVAFEKIQGTSVFGSITGETNDSVLVQEFASGTEYAIDIVSKDGEHKVAALWRYDKRCANDAPFVYFATEVVDAETQTGKIVCEYAFKALDALNIRHGLTHSEFIIDENDIKEEDHHDSGFFEGSRSGLGLGPRLVEVNCRQHNTNFAPLTMGAIGYNALDMLLASLLGDLPDLPLDTEPMRLSWDDLPQLPTTRAFAAVVHLVCFEEGMLLAINHDILEEIHDLPSVVAMEIYDSFEVGSYIEKTVDIRSDCGWVHIINDDEEQFQRDYDRIVELMPQMFVVDGNSSI